MLKRKISIWAFHFKKAFVDMGLMTENWRGFRDETCSLIEQAQTKKTEKNIDVDFNSFFKCSWKRFYLKWYGFEHASVLDSCPRSAATLKNVKCKKAVIFAELFFKEKLNPDREPFAGSPRYHLASSDPNSGKVISMLIDSVTVGKMVS